MSDERITWNIASDNYLQIPGEDEIPLQNVITGDYPEDATVTLTIKDKAGANVSGAVNLPMPHVSGTTGDQTKYRVIVPAGTPPKLGHYTGTITAVADGVTGTFYREIVVVRG
jgi:hypothetical protein